MDQKAREAMLQKVRNKLKEQKGSRRDPAMFRPPSVKQGDPAAKLRFVVLPGLKKGDKCVGGTVSEGMDDMFCISGGQHWINQRPYGCPRLFDSEECPWCELGFNLLNESDIDEERRKISRMYLPRSTFAVNIYFPAYKVNPPEYHNKVMWYLLPKTVYDKMEECLMREDAGDDPDDPQPSGLFFDPEACLVFQLEVTHKGGYNNYENSKFLLKPQSIGSTQEEIQAILDQRHDLWEKVPSRNREELDKLLEKLYNGSPEDSSPKKKEKPVEETAARAPDDDDEEESPLPSSKKKTTTKKSEAPDPKPDEPDLNEDIDDPELQNLIDQVQGDV